jgi:hypothetical protein
MNEKDNNDSYSYEFTKLIAKGIEEDIPSYYFNIKNMNTKENNLKKVGIARIKSNMGI